MIASFIRLALAAALALTVYIHAQAAETRAVPARDFLDSIGVNTTMPDRGQPLDKTVEMIRYGGFRWVRGGIEGLSDHGPTTLQTYLDLHRATGVVFSWGLVSGGTDVQRLVATGKTLASAKALLAFEGNNEPNNWGVTYQGEEGGGKAPSWLAVAKLQRDLYGAVQREPTLRLYSVWSISESGAERDNVGLQYLVIPANAGTLMPDGTRYASAANCHNYLYHPNAKEPADNKTWDAADPSPACRVDGLYGNFGVTWAGKFGGYGQVVGNLPRVTTETGANIEGPVTEQIHGLNLLSLYLDQFKRGWSNTAVYLLRDRTDEGGNQSFGFYDRDYRPRKAVVYLHNLTTILAGDVGEPSNAGALDYSIPGMPATMHEMLLRRGDGTFLLVVWDERLTGEDKVTVRFGNEQRSLRIYDPTVGIEPVRTLTGAGSLELALSDHPLIVSIPAK